jgi:hypothetical protein
VKSALAVVAYLVASLSTTAPVLPTQSSGPWKTLFNGKDFAGWTILAGASAAASAPLSTNPADRNWKIENGVITSVPPAAGQRGGTLATVEKFKDFELELEFLLAEAGTRCTPKLDGKQANLSEDRTCAFNSGVYLRTGYQLNIGRREAGEYIGVVVRRTGPAAVRGNVYWLSSGDCGSRPGYLEDCDQFPALRKKGDWNRVRVTFKGPRLQAWLNGTQIVDVVDDPTNPAEASWKEAAPIGFQFPPASESGGFAGFVKYRNIRAREL